MRDVIPAMSASQVFRAYLVEAKYEFLHRLRTPMFVIPFLLLPAGLYLLIGLLVAHGHVEPTAARFFLAGFCVFAAAGPALFGIGCPLALERDSGLFTLKRALPAPKGAYLVAKGVVAIVFATLAMATVFVTARFAGNMPLDTTQVIVFATVTIAGTVSLCALGLWIGVNSSGAAAPGLTQLIYMPMLYLSGLFFPLPKTLLSWAPIWPAFHIEQLALRAGHVLQSGFFDPKLSIAILVAITMVFGSLAMRRLVRAG